MALVEIEYGSVASSSVLNENFESLSEDIQTVASNLSTINANLAASIATVNTSLTSSIESLQTSLEELEESVEESIEELEDSAAGTYNKSSYGYIKLASGIIIQWGALSINTDDDITVTFPTSFTSGYYGFARCNLNSSSSAHAVRCTSYNSSTVSSITMHACGSYMKWVAIGY